ncbi:MAG: hypothetical protein GY769_08325 [bacterium]|nr:hypothetical protein [bacterium]
MRLHPEEFRLITNRRPLTWSVPLVLALAAALAAPGPLGAQGAGDCSSQLGQVTCPGDEDPAPQDARDTEPVIVAQENLWFTQPRRGGINYLVDGQLILPFEPLLGLTASSDSAAKMQEMQWLFRYTGQASRNAVFSVEWIAPRDLIDRNLRKTFLPLIELTEARWNIFYDPVLASVWRGLGPGPVDFSRPEIRQMFQDDLVYLRDLYFGHPNYWRIRSKPVLHVWAAKELVKNADELFRQARRSGIYICGDVFGQTGTEPPLDCRTGFTAATPDIVSRDRTQAVQEVLPAFESYFEDAGGLDLIPAFSFQYDDIKFRTSLGRGGTAIQILAQDRQDLWDWLDLADRYADPIDGTRYIWVGTLNGWAEATTIYPTEKSRSEFWEGGRLGVQPYHYAKLEVIQRRLYPDAAYRKPKIEITDEGDIVFRNCDVLAGVRVKAKIGGVIKKVDLESENGVSFLPNLDRVWRPDFEFQKLTIRVKNLDGKQAKAVIR